MSDSPTNTIVHFLENFTSRKFFSLVILVGFAAFLLWGFERFTGHFSVGRTSQEVDVLEKIVKLRTTQQLSPDEEIVRVSLLRRLSAAGVQGASSGVQSTASTTISTWRSTLASLMYRGGWGASPWILFALLVLIVPGDKKGSAALGAGFLGILFGLVAMIIPSPGGWWVVLGIPWGLFLVTIALILFIVGFSNRRKRNHPDTAQS